MLVGAAAGVVAFLFALVFGEGPVERAISFEAAHAADDHGHEAVGRTVQSTVGLATGTVVYAVALGGLFALAFAVAHGRVGRLSARATAALVALGGFVTVSLVPGLKYPANPPATGDPATIDQRTALFWLMVVISVAAGLLAVYQARALAPRWGAWNAAITAALSYVVLVAVAGLALRSFDEVPAGFPGTLLWNFRLAALGTQLAVWATLGLLFGALTQRAELRRPARV
jgi:hypothetical protein